MKYILILLKTNSPIVYVEFLLLSSCSCCKHLYTCILFYFDLILFCSIYFVVFHFSLFQCSPRTESAFKPTLSSKNTCTLLTFVSFFSLTQLTLVDVNNYTVIIFYIIFILITTSWSEGFFIIFSFVITKIYIYFLLTLDVEC